MDTEERLNTQPLRITVEVNPLACPAKVTAKSVIIRVFIVGRIVECLTRLMMMCHTEIIN